MGRYLERRFSLSAEAEACLEDGRKRPQVPLLDVFRCVFLLFASRLKSLNAMEEVLRRRGRPLVGDKVPSADTLGYAYARLPPDGQRLMLVKTAALARRKKMLRHRKIRTPWTVMVDGHELFSSFSRHCEKCLDREVKVAGEVRIQYYHRHVMAILVDAEPPMPFDLEMVEPGEGETVAARRLVERVMKDFPWVRLFTLDALYLEAPILKMIAATGRGAIVVLKQEERDLYKDVLGICSMERPKEAQTPDGVPTLYWDIPGLQTWTALEGIPVRVVRSIRTRKIRRRVKGEWKEAEQVQDWMWATVEIGPEIPWWVIDRLGHLRWDGENCGFNEQDRYFGLDHGFKHDPTAIRNFILTLFLASFLTEVFFTRNLKDPVLLRASLQGRVRLLFENPPGPGETCIWAQAP